MSPFSGARPWGMKTSLNPGHFSSSGAFFCPILGDDLARPENLRWHNRWPERAAPPWAACQNVCATRTSHRHNRAPMTGSGPSLGIVFEFQLPKMFQRQCMGRAAAGIEAMKFFRLAVPNDGEQIAAHAVAGGFNQTHQGIGGNGGVHGGAALFQDVQRGLRGQRLAGGGHAVTRDDFRARGETFSDGPVAGHHRQSGGTHNQEEADQFHRQWPK